MKILVVSDTHRNFAVLNDAVEENLDADLIIHLGDGENEARDVHNLHPAKPMIYVCGNCDYGMHKQKQIVTACGYKIYCCHGHNEDVHSGLSRLVYAAKAEDCKIALYGHTHLYRTEVIDDVFVMNPGSLDSPRNHNDPTYGVINISSAGEIHMKIVSTKK
ncbi:MAG: YfcE family phosphodiesterase [Oscillospiraceae bacterium]